MAFVAIRPSLNTKRNRLGLDDALAFAFVALADEAALEALPQLDIGAPEGGGQEQVVAGGAGLEPALAEGATADGDFAHGIGEIPVEDIVGAGVLTFLEAEPAPGDAVALLGLHGQVEGGEVVRHDLAQLVEVEALGEVGGVIHVVALEADGGHGKEDAGGIALAIGRELGGVGAGEHVFLEPEDDVEGDLVLEDHLPGELIAVELGLFGIAQPFAAGVVPAAIGLLVGLVAPVAEDDGALDEAVLGLEVDEGAGLGAVDDDVEVGVLDDFEFLVEAFAVVVVPPAVVVVAEGGIDGAHVARGGELDAIGHGQLLLHGDGDLGLRGLGTQDLGEDGQLASAGAAGDAAGDDGEVLGAGGGGLDEGLDLAAAEFLAQLGDDLFLHEVLEVGEDVEGVAFLAGEELGGGADAVASAAGDEHVGPGLEDVDEAVDLLLVGFAGQVAPHEPVGAVDAFVPLFGPAGADFVGDDGVDLAVLGAALHAGVVHVNDGGVLEVAVDFLDDEGQVFGHGAGDVEDDAEDFADALELLPEHHFRLHGLGGVAEAHGGGEIHAEAGGDADVVRRDIGNGDGGQALAGDDLGAGGGGGGVGLDLSLVEGGLGDLLDRIGRGRGGDDAGGHVADDGGDHEGEDEEGPDVDEDGDGEGGHLVAGHGALPLFLDFLAQVPQFLGKGIGLVDFGGGFDLGGDQGGDGRGGRFGGDGGDIVGLGEHGGAGRGGALDQRHGGGAIGLGGDSGRGSLLDDFGGRRGEGPGGGGDGGDDFLGSGDGRRLLCIRDGEDDAGFIIVIGGGDGLHHGDGVFLLLLDVGCVSGDGNGLGGGGFSQADGVQNGAVSGLEIGIGKGGVQAGGRDVVAGRGLGIAGGVGDLGEGDVGIGAGGVAAQNFLQQGAGGIGAAGLGELAGGGDEGGFVSSGDIGAVECGEGLGGVAIVQMCLDEGLPGLPVGRIDFEGFFQGFDDGVHRAGEFVSDILRENGPFVNEK